MEYIKITKKIIYFNRVWKSEQEETGEVGDGRGRERRIG